MKLLIAAIGFQDPYYPIKGPRNDYSLGTFDQDELWGRIVSMARRATSHHRPLTEDMAYGPVLGAIAAMMSGSPARSPIDEHPFWSQWTPDEVYLIYGDDTGPNGIAGPIKQRLEQTKLFLENSGIKVTPRPLDLSVFDYPACWTELSSHLLPVLTSHDGEPLDTRLLIGNATNALRLALFHLGVLTRQHGTQIWLSVDQQLAGKHMPAVRPLVHGEGFLPELVAKAELKEKELEIERLKQEISELKLKGGSADGEVVFVAGAERVTAQSLLDQMVKERDAPIWNQDGGLHMGRLRSELAGRLSASGIHKSAESLKRWFTEGKKEEAKRGHNYLILDEAVRRPEA